MTGCACIVTSKDSPKGAPAVLRRMWRGVLIDFFLLWATRWVLYCYNKADNRLITKPVNLYDIGYSTLKNNFSCVYEYLWSYTFALSKYLCDRIIFLGNKIRQIQNIESPSHQGPCIVRYRIDIYHFIAARLILL